MSAKFEERDTLHADCSHSSANVESNMDFCLKNYKFMCRDFEATSEFYQHGLHMNVERQQDVGSKVQIVFHYTNADVGILFECERALVNRKVSTILDGNETQGGGRQRPTIAADANLLIYVNEIASIVENLKQRDFYIRIDVAETQPGIRSAVVVDPNGVRITLMECDSIKVPKPSVGRIGYFTWPVRDFSVIDKVCAFWDFLSAKPSLLQSRSARAPHNPWRDPYVAGREVNDHRMDERSGFRVVDAEKFVEDLTSYCWLANGSRGSHPAVCYRHKAERRAAVIPHHAGSQLISSLSQNQTMVDTSQTQVHIFLGLQIVVFELPRAIQRLQEQTICELRATDAILSEVPGLPRFCTAIDPAGVQCEVTDNTVPSLGKKGKAVNTSAAEPTNSTVKRVGPSTLESSGSGAYTGSVNDPTVAARLVADEFFDDPEELEVRGPVAGATAAPRLFGPGSE